MESALLQASLALALAAILGVYVATRSERSLQRWLLLGLLLSLGLWSSGALVRTQADTQGGVELGLLVGFLGVAMLPGFWLLLAAHHARSALLGRHFPAALVAVLAPSVLAYSLLVSNESHFLFFAARVPPHASSAQLAEVAGPAYWAFVVWVQLCVLGGALLLLDSVRRMRSPRARRPAVLLMLAAVTPLLVNVLFLGHVIPGDVDPTPLAVGVSLALLVAATFRFGVFDGTLPLARRDVIEHLSDAILIADTDGIVLDRNPAAASLLGGQDPRGRVLHAVLRDLQWDEDEARVEAALAAVATGASPALVQLRACDDRWLELRSALVRAPQGMPAGRYVLLHDRTEQQRYERFVHQSQKLETVGGMVAGLAHEVNNPLAYVRSNLGALAAMATIVESRLEAFDEKDRDDLGEMRVIVEETLDGVERIGRIVDGLRRFSRPPSEDARPVDVNAVARQAIRLAGLHGERDVAVAARLGEGLPFVKGSADRLGQALLNLLMNAKHALAGRPFGRITVETVAYRQGVEVHVSDNGPGIPEEIQHRIFDPFFTTKGPDEGTGLGLSIAFDIVREHGGTIELVSRPGEGARFILRLPGA